MTVSELILNYDKWFKNRGFVVSENTATCRAYSRLGETDDDSWLVEFLIIPETASVKDFIFYNGQAEDGRWLRGYKIRYPLKEEIDPILDYEIVKNFPTRFEQFYDKHW